MKIQELREKKIEELKVRLQELAVSLHDLNFKVANSQVKNIREIRDVKKMVARIETIICQKELNK
ncbi:50S ribosomal protein L29 [Candidatus Falkowbacteria bacterium RIFOXYD2_FULL_35_9]|uniref:Large ribosomal subunit protein uL29 n=1 Tax=Candidatus Falkowbacteria bacterium RIFOXYC2_FULL_36_12 TaxID=1798002 RepID=A0A1F5SWZ2_9BACT|nr:MAG: 50S ribosomal protein L29 [Candidatus Falkowbacteria bacterium RIFOXYB2_FULL_35_7]OGF30973.1 MAG: 50S ribosomal protein L29 [Candidatus Falkowbacteria bacterium RIFOXYC2_FULL_36_12]OGF34401.1 MAG: 50S ribosomal protein L29 [Candidatus Falkowbacteria bacterium RIFOXYA2_FULL_35_8]OGF47298.1 MAG: 50S ribosomal protein L29 [Candidatus Falkowbacteria bacterium RIFOXYD2_FULL_35_9]